MLILSLNPGGVVSGAAVGQIFEESVFSPAGAKEKTAAVIGSMTPARIAEAELARDAGCREDRQCRSPVTKGSMPWSPAVFEARRS